MAQVGFFCFPGRGHLDPTAVLGRRLVSRGHVVTVFQSRIAEPAIKSAGLQFRPIDDLEPRGLPRRSLLSSRKREPLLRAMQTVDALKMHAQRVLREGNSAIIDSGIDAAVVDQMDLAAGTVAEIAGIPFLNLSCGVPVYLDELCPAPYFGWAPMAGAFGRIRNRSGNAVIERMIGPVLEMVNGRRRLCGLIEFTHLNDVFSQTAIVTQLPRALEFEDRKPVRHIFYTGQFSDCHPRKLVSFPWGRLNGKPLIFASMGTVRNNDWSVFQIILDACAPLNVQVVLSLGAGKVRPKDLKASGDAVIVEYAPQLDLIRRSILVVNCAGLNTTLDCVSSGIPMVAIPVAEDQPGIAARIRERKIGIVIPIRRLSTAALRAAILAVLQAPLYIESVRRLQAQIRNIEGADMAVQIVERALRIASQVCPAAVPEKHNL